MKSLKYQLPRAFRRIRNSHRPSCLMDAQPVRKPAVCRRDVYYILNHPYQGILNVASAWCGPRLGWTLHCRVGILGDTYELRLFERYGLLDRATYAICLVIISSSPLSGRGFQRWYLAQQHRCDYHSSTTAYATSDPHRFQ